MGWSGGSDLMQETIEILKEHVEEDARVAIYKRLIKAFENHDWDTIDEALEEDPAFDKAYQLLYPEEYQEWKECQEEYEYNDESCTNAGR